MNDEFDNDLERTSAHSQFVVSDRDPLDCFESYVNADPGISYNRDRPISWRNADVIFSSRQSSHGSPVYRYPWVGPTIGHRLMSSNSAQPVVSTEPDRMDMGNGETGSTAASKKSFTGDIWTLPTVDSYFRSPTLRQTDAPVPYGYEYVARDNSTSSRNHDEDQSTINMDDLIPLFGENSQPPMAATCSNSGVSVQSEDPASVVASDGAQDPMTSAVPTIPSTSNTASNVTTGLMRATPVAVRPELFHAVMRMIALAEGGIIVERRGPEFDFAVADANYGMQINDRYRLVYTHQYGLELVDFIYGGD